MKKTKHTIICSAIAASLCTALQAAHTPEDSSSKTPTASSRASSSLGHVERATQFLKRDVYDSSDRKVGAVDDVVVDLESGRVLYVVVDSRDDDKAAVAPGAFSSSRGGHLRLSADATQNLKNAPQFTREIDRPETISKADFVDQVYKHFGESAWWKGSTSSSAGSFNNVHKASEVIGMNVQSVNTEPVGDVQNLALDMPAGRILYVILSPDRDLKLGNALYALPPDAFTLAADKKTLSSNINREKLASAPHFTNNQWSRLSDPAFASRVYQYYGKQAYFDTTPGALQPTGRDDSSVYEDQERETESDKDDSRRDDSTSSRGGWDRSRSSDSDR